MLGLALVMAQQWPGRTYSHVVSAPVNGCWRVMMLPVCRSQARGSIKIVSPIITGRRR